MHKGSNPTARATNPITGGPPDPIPKGRPDPKTGGRPDPKTGGRPPKKWRETGPKPAVRAVAKNCWGGAVAGFVPGTSPELGPERGVRRTGGGAVTGRRKDSGCPLLQWSDERLLVSPACRWSAAARATSALERGCRGGHKGRTKGVLMGGSEVLAFTKDAIWLCIDKIWL